MHYRAYVSDITDPRGDLQWGTIPGLVADAAARFGETEALVDGHGPGGTTIRMTFSQLAEAVEEASRAILANGIERGDRVAIWAPNCAEWVVAALGTVGAGALLVPLNTRYKGAEAACILKESGARILFTVQGFLGNDYPAMLSEAVTAGVSLPDLERVIVFRTGGTGDSGDTDGSADTDGDADCADSADTAAGTFTKTLPARRRSGCNPGDQVLDWTAFIREGACVPGDVAAGRTASITSGDLSDLIFTSGTTGHPKGAMTTHGQTLRTFATWAAVTGLHRGDRYLIVNPFFHTFGYKAGLLACLMTGATMVTEPIFDVDVLVRTVTGERVTVLPGPPTIFQSILDRPDRDKFDLSSLRLVVTGAALIPVELVRRLQSELRVGTVVTAYGLTEATGTVTMSRREDSAEIIAGTSGRAIPEVEVRVIAGDGGEVARGEAGEIVVRGYNVMRGYFNDEEGTDEVIDPKGWLHTGDVGAMDEEGNLKITDRLKDMYVSGGFNVYPAEIEAVLRDHPAVAQVAVVGVPDDRMGEVGCAYIVGAPGTSLDQIVDALPAWSRDRLANFKAPKFVEMIDALPVNAGGKVLKRELRARFSARS